MNAAEGVLKLLEENRGEYISGEEMARSLAVSRNSVWKAVKALRASGYSVEAVTNKGYRLSPECDLLSAPGIEKHLTVSGLRLEIFRSVSSTNTVLKKYAEDGAAEGTVLVAGEQTAGKGRLGRGFYSPPDSGLYISALLRPWMEAEKASLITTIASVAVCEALEKVAEVNPQIKWVNDVFLNGKKICGILTEASFGMESRRLEYAVLGVGINVFSPAAGFPDDIADVAGSVFDDQGGDMKNHIAAEFLNRFFFWYDKLESREFVPEYRRRSMVTGRGINVISGAGIRAATALEIDDDCRLVVRYDDGEVEALSSGEISIRIRK